jgi:hypothetical protein
MNPVIVSCGWDKVVKVSSHSSERVTHCGMMLYIIFATSEGLNHPMRLHIISPRSLTTFHQTTTSVDHRLLTAIFLGLGALQVQAEDKPPRPHRIHQHHLRFPRWLVGRLWRKGRYHDALGSQRSQAPVLTRGRRRRQRPRVLP